MATDNYQSRYWDMEWVGKLPTDWQFIKNRYIFNFNHGKINLSNDTPVLSLTTTGVKIKTNLNFGKSTENYVGHQLVFPGDLVFSPRDFDQTPILSGVAKDYGCISNLYFVMKTKKEIYNEFVNYFWWGIKYGIEYFKEFSYGMRSSFNRFQFNEITFIKPPIETQKKIVSYLDKKTKMIALIIEKKKKLIELLKEKRISIITQAVTKGLNPKAKMKPTGVEWIGEIPEEWKLSRLRFLSKINPSKSEINTVQNIKVTFLPMPLVTELGKIELTDEKDLDVVSEGFTYFSNNDVIFAKITPCFENYKGAVVKNLVNNIGFGSTEFVVLRPEKIDPFFIYYITMTHSFRNIGELEMRGSAGQQRITTEFVKNFICQYPDLEKQKIISATILQKTNNLDLSINKTEKQIKTLLEYRSSLIYNAVTGKIGI